MDLILRDSIARRTVDQTVYQKHMAAGTSAQKHLRPQRNFGVGDVLEQCGDAGQHEVIVGWRSILSCLWTEKSPCSEHVDMEVPFSRMGPESLRFGMNRDTLQNEMAHYPRSKDDPLPRGLTHTQGHNQPSLSFEIT